MAVVDSASNLRSQSLEVGRWTEQVALTGGEWRPEREGEAWRPAELRAADATARRLWELRRVVLVLGEEQERKREEQQEQEQDQLLSLYQRDLEQA